LKLHPIIRDYFTFTRNERIGLIILLLIIVLVALADHFIYYFETPGEADRKMFQHYLNEMAKREQLEAQLKMGNLFAIDPNTVDSLALDSFALPTRVKVNLLKYREKGGHFFHAKDLMKIYGMNDSIFSRVAEYIQIASHKQVARKQSDSPRQITHFVDSKNTQTTVKQEQKKLVIELNSATPEDLIKLSGIGPVFSKRIVKFRNLLGGFYNLHQLGEVYGLKQETIEKILPYLKLDVRQIKKLNINFETAEQLAHHPYISWDVANAIVDFRSRNGFINAIRLLQKNDVLNETDFQRISPYLKTKN